MTITEDTLRTIIHELTEAKKAASLENASFGFPNDRIEIKQVHFGHANRGRVGDVLHPDDYVKRLVRLHHASWISGPIDRALELLKKSTADYQIPKSDRIAAVKAFIHRVGITEAAEFIVDLQSAVHELSRNNAAFVAAFAKMEREKVKMKLRIQTEVVIDKVVDLDQTEIADAIARKLADTSDDLEGLAGRQLRNAISIIANAAWQALRSVPDAGIAILSSGARKDIMDGLQAQVDRFRDTE